MDFTRRMLDDRNKYQLIISLMNEGHSMNYEEPIVCTLMDAVSKSHEIITALDKILPRGSFSVQLQNDDGEILGYVVNKQLVNKHFVPILKITL